MIYISTPFSRKAADFLAEIGVPAFKIGSGEADNLPLIRHIARFGKPVILSTGMQTIETIRESVAILDASGVDYALLECTNLYPSPPEIVSLQGVTDLQRAFPRAVVGFSDHSIGPEMALASVALGACILERHYTDTRYRVGPDIINSMDPAELRFLIDRSREIHTALHNPKQRTQAEEPVYRFARASRRGRPRPARGPCDRRGGYLGPPARDRARSRAMTSTWWWGKRLTRAVHAEHAVELGRSGAFGPPGRSERALIFTARMRIALQGRASAVDLAPISAMAC